MGELLGIPEWLAKTLFVVAVLCGWLLLGFIMHRRGQRRLVAKRPSPSRDEFITMLAHEVDADIAGWLWDQALPYYDPLTPHPDDHLTEDAMIDDDDIALDWLPRFAEMHELNHKDWPDWPTEWEATVLNYARWLRLGLTELSHPTQRHTPAGT